MTYGTRSDYCPLMMEGWQLYTQFQIVNRLRFVTETLPHIYYKFMTSLPRQGYPAHSMNA
jgi:hypothetical protein